MPDQPERSPTVPTEPVEPVATAEAAVPATEQPAEPIATEPAVELAPETPADSPFERVPTLLRTALEAKGFTALTQVQLAALDAIDQARDLRISSQTGSGKTVALGLAIAPELIEAGQHNTQRGPTALIVVPTRELAAQVHKELAWLYANVPGVRLDSVTGGTNVGQERRRLARRTQILVGTPGRLVDHIGSGALDGSSIRQLVLDEADQMLDMGFREDLESILTAIPQEGRRTHMLSATFPAGVLRLAKKFQTNPLNVEGTELGRANDDIRHIGHVVRPHQRYGAVVNLLLLAGDKRTLIFVARRADASKLAEKLSGDGFAAMPLSGDLPQAARTRTLNAFRTGQVKVLVATDVAARGLDVPEVSTVIHGDLPMDSEVYTHRSGRTGRAGRKGQSLLLATPNAQRRAMRILADARVDAEWQPVANAAQVKKKLVKRTRRHIRKAIDEGETPNEAQVEFARSLLEKRDPAVVVATLLAERENAPSREPFDIEAPPPPRHGQRPDTRRFDAPRPGNGYNDDRRPQRRHRDDDYQDSRRPAPRRAPGGNAEAGFTRFRITYGFRQGANPRRVLAAVCRRGDVSSRLIGAIQIDAFESSFDVASDAANAFERRTSKQDSRDPDQRIERVGAKKSYGKGKTLENG